MRIILVGLCWFIAMSIACSLDAGVARLCRQTGIESFLRGHGSVHVPLKMAGGYGFVVFCSVAVYWIQRPDWRGAAFVALAPMISLINGLTKWILGRHRPYRWGFGSIDDLRPFDFDWFRGGLPGVLHETNLSFPSGHACLAFATATALAILWPRWRWAFYALAALTAAERVLDNSHWLSDTVAAAALGIGGVKLVHWLLSGLHARKALSVPRDSCVQRAGEYPDASGARARGSRATESPV